MACSESLEKWDQSQLRWEHDSSTPIYIAAKKGHKEIVEMLLKEGADTSKRTKKGETPLQAAVQGGFAEIVKMIIKTGTTDREDYEQSLKLVANNPYPKVIKLLLKQYLVNSSCLPPSSSESVN